jgi:hypothetical protein
MSNYTIEPLTAATWDAFAQLAARHSGGGCWCTWFHPESAEKHVSAEGNLYNGTRSLFEKAGFSYERPKGKNHCVIRRTVSAS